MANGHISGNLGGTFSISRRKAVTAATAPPSSSANNTEPTRHALAQQALDERIAQNIDELVIAIACIRGDETAWAEGIEPLRPVLVRMCELRVDEADSTLHAARFLMGVRKRTFGEDCEFEDGIPRLQEYAGIQPLRSYLGGPLFAILQDLIKDGLAVATPPSTTVRATMRNLRLVN